MPPPISLCKGEKLSQSFGLALAHSATHNVNRYGLYTPGANLHAAKKKSAVIFLVTNFAEAKRRTAGPLTNKNAAGMSMTPHQNFVDFCIVFVVYSLGFAWKDL